MMKGVVEKRMSITSKSKSWSRTPGCVAIILSQHILLWTSLYVAGSTLYILGVQAVYTNDVPSVVLLLVSSFVSLSYIILQNVTTHLRKNARNRMQSETVDTCQSLASHTLRILCTIWMVTVALNVTFTAARRALCASAAELEKSTIRLLDRGSTCLVNRVGILASAIALLACGILFILLHKVHEPFRCHLFGFTKEDRLMPLFLPYERPKTIAPTYSDMSFKCRSSTSLSSQTLAALCSCDSKTNLIASRPQGLGISTAANKSAPSLLHPRPSLSSIRSYVTMSLPPPPTSPLPPLPTYIPNKFRSANGIHKRSHRSAPPRPARSDDTLRLVAPSPALTHSNLARNDSLSSIYSRSISGETRPPTIRTNSSSSTATLKKSPLGLVTLAEDLDEAIAMSKGRFRFEDDEDEDIDDVKTLEQRLANARRRFCEADVERDSALSREFECKPWPLEVSKSKVVGYGCAF